METAPEYDVTAGCPDDNCPKILAGRTGTAAEGLVQVQGYVVVTEGLPPGEGRISMAASDLERLAAEHLNLT